MSSALETIRADFDSAFALPPRPSSHDLQAFLTIRVGARPYALKLSELGWITAAPRLTTLPSSDPALLGLGFIRGATVPVFDLAVVLGETSQPDVRWIVLSIGPDPVGFAFAALEGHLRVEPRELVTISNAERQLTNQVIKMGPEQRPIIQVDAAVDRVLGARNENRDRTNA